MWHAWPCKQGCEGSHKFLSTLQWCGSLGRVALLPFILSDTAASFTWVWWYLKYSSLLLYSVHCYLKLNLGTNHISQDLAFGICLPQSLVWVTASWVVLIYHLISPKGKMRSELSVCSGSALCGQPPGNVHLHGCKGNSYPSLSWIYCSAVSDIVGKTRHYFAHVHHPQMAFGFHHHFVSS